jgi:hypothetical protein
MLYQLSNRTTFRSRNADDVFKGLKLGGFHDITGTTDELVQYFVERGRIKFGSGSQLILTQEGKNWCDSHCESHLQDSISVDIVNSFQVYRKTLRYC